VRIESTPHWIELRVTEFVPPELPRAGDARIEFEASINGYTGWGSCWVAADDFQDFQTAVSALYLSLQGAANLKSMSPEEMSLSLSVANSRGHIRVEFACAKDSPFRCSMTGRFEIDQTQLREVLHWQVDPRSAGEGGQ
jgi:hypothetical protein